MYNKFSDEQLQKYTFILSVLKKENTSFIRKMDTLLTQKRFDNEYSLTLDENILKANVSDFSKKDALNIIANFIDSADREDIFKKRNLHELVKLSQIDQTKLLSFIKPDIFTRIAEKLFVVLNKSTSIQYDFIILTISLNILSISKLEGSEVFNLFTGLKKSVYAKFLTFEYSKTVYEKEEHFLCWVDKLLNATINDDIKASEFIYITQKIIPLSKQNLYTYRKLLYAVSFLLLQEKFSTNQELKYLQRLLKKEVKKRIDKLVVSLQDVEDVTIKVLAEEKIFKEDFYYMFDVISAYNKSKNADKSFVFEILFYIVYFHKKYNIFNYRFIRNYFFNMVIYSFDEYDSLDTKRKALNLFIKLLHIDVFFTFNRFDIVDKIIKILASINVCNIKLTHNNFYKYCDILDYLYANNPELIFHDTINRICANNDNSNKIMSHFELSKIKSA